MKSNLDLWIKYKHNEDQLHDDYKEHSENSWSDPKSDKIMGNPGMCTSYRRSRGILHAKNVWSNFNHAIEEATEFENWSIMKFEKVELHLAKHFKHGWIQTFRMMLVGSISSVWSSYFGWKRSKSSRFKLQPWSVHSLIESTKQQVK
jgi:hypothetical protein